MRAEVQVDGNKTGNPWASYFTFLFTDIITTPIKYVLYYCDKTPESNISFFKIFALFW